MAGQRRGDLGGDFGSIPDPDDIDTGTDERYLDLIPTDAVIAAAKRYWHEQIQAGPVRQKYRPDGGAERFVSRALEALDSSNLELNVITREWQGPVKPDWNIHICNPRKWGGSAANAVLPTPPASCGRANISIWCRAMNAFPAATCTAPETAYTAAGYSSARAFARLEKPPAVCRPLPSLCDAG